MSYEEHQDKPHAAVDHPLWQESDCYWFWDSKARIGGFHRVGQHPSRGMGQVMLFVFELGGQRYRHVSEHKLRADARDEVGQRVHSSEVRALGGGLMNFGWNDPDCSGELRFEDPFYPPRDWSKSGHGRSVQAQMNAGGHLECSGRIRGRIRLGTQERQIDALAHRDRSWGARDISRVGQHRMFSGTHGHDLSFAAFGLGLKGVGRHAAGFVVREGVEEDIGKVRILATLDNDGVTAVSGEAQLTLVSGEEIIVQCRVQQSFLHVTSGYAVTDSISLSSSAGSTGFCDLEVANNPHQGSYLPSLGELDQVCSVDGLTSASEFK